MVSVQLVRHATLLVRTGGTTFLIDPMLDPARARNPIPNTPNEARNPLVELPAVELDPDAVVVTHTHTDHLDATAAERLDLALPVFCQPGTSRRSPSAASLTCDQWARQRGSTASG